MNKDALSATLIGLGIGLLLTGIILVGPTVLKKIPHLSSIHFSQITLPKFSFPKKTNPAVTTQNNESKNPTQQLTIDSPLAEAIETDSQVLISGSAQPNAKIVIQGSVDDAITIANSEGKYAGKITLAEGKNDILITSYTANNEQTTQQRTVYYTPEQW